MRSGKRLINGPALSTPPLLAPLSPSTWERKGICSPALAKAGEQLGTEAVEQLGTEAAEVTAFAHTAHILLQRSSVFRLQPKGLCSWL